MRTTGTRWPTWPTSFTVPVALRMAGATVVELTPGRPPGSAGALTAQVSTTNKEQKTADPR
eukprot:5401269-Prymnesium_polylepis.1